MHLDEDSIVRMLKARFSTASPLLAAGIGDDAAVIRGRGREEEWIVTTDMLVEDVDFRRDWISPSQLGHKSLAVNLSDLAAMGARPEFYLVALALPEGLGKAWVASLYSGLTRLGRTAGALLAGGDLSSSRSGIQIAITAAGSTKRRGALLRSGGEPGDALLVTGCLGRSAAGLKLLQQGIVRGRTRHEREALAAHRTPVPRCDVGRWLAEKRFARSTMDLSDGLSADLPRLCRASRTGAEIFAERIPVFEYSRSWNCDPLQLALHGGEDFELLFSVSLGKLARLQQAYPRHFPPATVIGRLTAGRAVVWHPRPGARAERLPRLGWDHFRSHGPAPENSCNHSGPSGI